MKIAYIILSVFISVTLSSCCKHADRDSYIQHTPNPTIRQQVDAYRARTPEKDRFLGPIRTLSLDKINFDALKDYPFMGKRDNQRSCSQSRKAESPMKRKVNHCTSPQHYSETASASAITENGTRVAVHTYVQGSGQQPEIHTRIFIKKKSR